MYLSMRRLLLTITIVNLLFLLGCASTPPAQVTSDELGMLAEIQRERGERSAQVASKLLHKTKAVREKAGTERALQYLMRIGVHYPYEALKIRRTLFADHPPTQFDDELEMLAEIQRERGTRNAQVALKFLQQTKAIQQKAGRQGAVEYLMRIGTRYPYEAMKIRETLFGERAEARAERVTEGAPPSPKERTKAPEKPMVPPTPQKDREPTRDTGRRDPRGDEFLSQGMKAYENGEYQLCIDKLSEAIPFLREKRKRIEAFKTMAFAYMAFPKKEEARQQFSNILKVDPDFELDPIMTPPKILAIFEETKEKFVVRPGFRKKFALVIGISNYRKQSKTGLTNLLFADDDAHDFSAALKKLGWRSSYIKTLINERATKRNIEIALESWFTKAGQDDLIVLFWSGHGFHDPEDPERVYFACYDSEIAIPATGYRMDRVRRSLEERGARNVLFFADTCHAGRLITRGERGVSVVPHLQQLRKEKKIPKGWIFMVGAETDRHAVENSSWSNGAFTHCLIEGILGKADGFESTGPKDGIVTMGELRAYLNTAMPEETQKVLGVAKRPLITTTTGDPSIWDLSLTD